MIVSRKKLRFFGILVLINFTVVFSQQKEFSGDPDVAFEKARNLAFNSQRKAAQDSLRFILTKYPNYLDIRSFLATTYAWDGSYKLARKEFAAILKKDPERKSDWIASIKNELWGEYPYNALDLSNSALKVFKEEPEIMLLKANAQEKTKDPERALETLEEILAKHPTHKEALSDKESLVDRLSNNSIGVTTSVDIFKDNERDIMEYYTVDYSRQTKYGSIIAKVNINRRFETTGVQYEVDMYPKIRKGLYAYTSFGYSNTGLFPEIRYGGELHQSLPKSFEASLGFRALKFSETTIIYTGSVGWYTGNSYWAFRTYMTPGGAGLSKSGTLTYRKYRSDAANYFGVAVGVGFSPEFDPFPVNDVVDVPKFDLKSQKIDFSYNFTSKNKKNIWGTTAGISHEEQINAPGTYFLIYTLGVSYSIKFK
jgi:YaiO family outer membrane protein